MKTCLSLLAAAALLLGLCSCGGNRFRLEVETAPETGCDNCTVYLFARMGNQLTLVDSARLVRHAAQLSGPLPDPESLVELLIPGQGSYILLAARGERVSLRIDTAARSFFPACRGSFATERMTEISRRYREIGYGALEQLRSEAAAPGLDARRRQELEALLAAREAELDSLARSAIFNDRSALLAVVATMWYADTSPNMTEDSLRALVRQLRARFPGSPCLNSLDEQATPEPPTRESMRTENLRARLSGLPEPYPEGAEQAPGGAPEPEPGTEACSLPPYAVGERVEAFSLPDGEGVRRNPLEAAEEYVLLGVMVRPLPQGAPRPARCGEPFRRGALRLRRLGRRGCRRLEERRGAGGAFAAAQPPPRPQRCLVRGAGRPLRHPDHPAQPAAGW